MWVSTCLSDFESNNTSSDTFLVIVVEYLPFEKWFWVVKITETDAWWLSFTNKSCILALLVIWDAWSSMIWNVYCWYKFDICLIYIWHHTNSLWSPHSLSRPSFGSDGSPSMTSRAWKAPVISFTYASCWWRDPAGKHRIILLKGTPKRPSLSLTKFIISSDFPDWNT